MQKSEEESVSITASTSGSESVVDRKTWETPKLKVLPVPSKTLGGPFRRNDQDNRLYKKS